MSDISNDFSNKKQRLGRGLGSLLGGQPPSVDNLKTGEVFSANGSVSTGKNQIETNKTPSQPPANSITASKKPNNVQYQTDLAPNHEELKRAPFAVKNEVNESQVQSSIPQEMRIWKISIDKLGSGKFQPRTNFEKEKLEELSTSIKANGILQPIVARRLLSGRFEIIAGERRWRAAQLAGLHEVPVIIKEIENQNALELAIIENIQREDLNPIEEGLAYSRLIEEFKLTQQQVADKVGKDRATIANLLRVLQLPKEIRELVREQKISVGHAKVLLGVNSVADMIELANKIPLQNMSVRQCEKAVANLNLKNGELNKHHDSDLDLRKKMVGSVEDQLQKKLGTKVQIDYNSGKGKISIQFYSDAEFNQLVEKLKE